MKKLLLTFLTTLSFFVFALEELPKECLGYYAGEMPAYTVTRNDIEMNIDKHDVSLQITRYDIFYKSGLIELKGSYTLIYSAIFFQIGSQNGRNFFGNTRFFCYAKLHF